MRILLAVAALAAGAVAVSPIADAIAPTVVGGAVPTRIQDLAGYLSLKPIVAATATGQLGPISPTDPTQAGKLRELGALSLGAGAAVAAIAYAVLVRVLK